GGASRGRDGRPYPRVAWPIDARAEAQCGVLTSRRTSRLSDAGQSLRPGGIDPARWRLARSRNATNDRHPPWPWITRSGIAAVRTSGKTACQTTLPLIAQGCSGATKRAGKKQVHVSLRQHVSGNFLIWYKGMEVTSRLQRSNRTWHGLHHHSVPRRDKFEDAFDRSALPARCVRTTRPRGRDRSRRSGGDDDVLPQSR